MSLNSVLTYRVKRKFDHGKFTWDVYLCEEPEPRWFRRSSSWVWKFCGTFDSKEKAERWMADQCKPQYDEETDYDQFGKEMVYGW